MNIGNSHWFDPNDGEAARKRIGRMVKIGLGLIALLLVLSHSFLVVQAGERAVIYSSISGVQPYQFSEGLHFTLPVIWHPIKYDIKTRTYTMSGEKSEAPHEIEDNANRIQVPDDSLTALTAAGL